MSFIKAAFRGGLYIPLSRANSAGNQVLTEGGTLQGPGGIRKIAALRMSHAFMKYMRQGHLAGMQRPDVTLVYVAVCNVHGLLPLQWLEQWGQETEHPPCRGPALHFHAPRFIAPRGGDRNEETPATENEREVLICRACAHTLSPRSLFWC